MSWKLLEVHLYSKNVIKEIKIHPVSFLATVDHTLIREKNTDK